MADEAQSSRVRDVFGEALELEAPERSAFLEAIFRREPELRRSVEELLRIAQIEGIELDATDAMPSAVPDPWDELEGDTIDRYRLLRPLGRGGFGVVWLAEQLQPVQRVVALKVIKLGMDTSSVIARFRSELQVLALMEHPNIARVLDAGTSARGRPYFAMEPVFGAPLLQYCEQSAANVVTRLGLFSQVCRAIHHAHQKGVIHRDIKPSNVLVTQIEDTDTEEPVVKVIDFGIAKATSGALSEGTLTTLVGQLVGTPAYMSPEQADLGAVDVDTRSDVYSLGALLYTLLTGSAPFPMTGSHPTALIELVRAIREDTPERPSARLRRQAADREGRPLDVRDTISKDAAEVSGDLDWIVLKCLDKEPARRYESAAALAEDVARYIAGAPVSAVPPTARYLMRKFVRRHRFGVAAALGSVALLTAGILGTSAGMFAARRAERHQADLRQQAELQMEGNRVVTHFFSEMIALGDPRTSGRPDLTVRELILEVEPRLEGALAGQPRAEAMVRLALGRALLGLDESERAEASLRRATDLLDEHVQGDLHLRYRAYQQLSLATTIVDRGNFHRLQRSLALGTEVVALDQPILATKMREFVAALVRRDVVGTLASADRIAAFVEAAGTLPRSNWDPVLRCLEAASDFALFCRRPEVAIMHSKNVVALAATRAGSEAYDVAQWRARLGNLLFEAGRLEEASLHLQEVYIYVQSHLHPSHHLRADIEAAYGLVSLANGRFATAEEILSRVTTEAAHMRRSRPASLAARSAYIGLLAERGQEVLAAPIRFELAQRMLETRLAFHPEFVWTALGPGRSQIIHLAKSLGAVLNHDGPESEALYADLQPLLFELLEVAPIEASLLATKLAQWTDDCERAPRALRRQICKDALLVLERTGQGPYSGGIVVRRELYKHAMAAHDYEEAERHIREVLRRTQVHWGSASWLALLAERELGSLLRVTKRPVEALGHLRRAFQALFADEGADYATKVAARDLVCALIASGLEEEAFEFIPTLAALIGDPDAPFVLQDDRVDRATPGLCERALEVRWPSLAIELRALRAELDRCEAHPGRSPDSNVLARVLAVHRASAAAPSAVAEVAFAATILRWARLPASDAVTLDPADLPVPTGLWPLLRSAGEALDRVAPQSALAIQLRRGQVRLTEATSISAQTADK